MQAIARLSELADGTIKKVTLDKTEIVLVRSGDMVRAFGAKCPHAGAPLEQGAVCHGRLVCPWHKSVFKVEDGSLVEPPALDGLTCYPGRLDGDDVLVSSEPMPPSWPARSAKGGTVAIIGSGAAAAAAASALRQAGLGGRVLMIGDEAPRPYDRTVLSKFVVAAEMKPDEVPPLRDQASWDELGVERLAGTVTKLDARGRRIELAGGIAISYDVALLATGSIPRRPSLPGIELSGVYTLRKAEDARAIVAATTPGTGAVILGASFIGLEVASGLRKRGVGVTVVAPEAVPFEKQFGKEIGAVFRRLHERNGVIFHLGAEAAALKGSGRVRQVVLNNGDSLNADTVIVGVGVTPATGFVDGVSRAEDNGIIVDDGMRAVEALFVAGDCAAFPLHGERVRIEHWRVAQQQGRVAALGIMGQKQARYDGVPFFWTRHFGKRFEYLGHAEQWDALHIEGDLDAEDFVAFQLSGERVLAVIACGRDAATARLVEEMRRPLSLAEARAVVAAA